MEFTESVRSFQVPATPGTTACPPSLPSVPTSRATRVTSAVNTPNCWIMVFTMFAERRNSPSSGRPSTSSRTVWVRLPCATAAIARVTSVVGLSRSSTNVLTETSMSSHAPRLCSTRIRSRVLPSFPTAWPTLFSSKAICSFAVTISLKLSAIFPGSPVHETGGEH